MGLHTFDFVSFQQQTNFYPISLISCIRFVFNKAQKNLI